MSGHRGLAIAAIGAIGLLALTVLFLMPVERTLATPFFRFIQLIALLLSGIPQALIWALMLGLGLILALRNVPARGPARSTRKAPFPKTPGRLEVWLRLLADADRGDYFRWRKRSSIVSP